MSQEERLDYLINSLLAENEEYERIAVPKNPTDKRRLLRSLMNLRPPRPASRQFLDIQDQYLKEECLKKGITVIADLSKKEDGIYLWQGDITTLAADAIVNAANSQMLGCFVPCHGCIDNAIHSAAGIQLRLECARIMKQQGKPEPAGMAKITKAYNLPCRYVIHTVGPIIYDKVREEDCELLAGCYRSCLELASAYGLKSLAFCCISTGEFRFPNEQAACIAVETVRKYLKEEKNGLEVVFNVFKDRDREIYERLLG